MGFFCNERAVWHKEILFALSAGVRVYGAASIGALRAAECEQFGRIGVGRIYNSYRTGARTSDADVALCHAPEALGFRPLTLALVDVESTLFSMQQSRKLSAGQSRALEISASRLHFSERTWQAVVDGSDVRSIERATLASILAKATMSQKEQDARLLLCRTPPQLLQFSYSTGRLYVVGAAVGRKENSINHQLSDSSAISRRAVHSEFATEAEFTVRPLGAREDGLTPTNLQTRFSD